MVYSLVGVSLDYDGTLSLTNGKIPTQFPTAIEKKLVEILENNKQSFVLIFLGSARQSIETDLYNHARNKNGLFFVVIQNLLNEFRKSYPHFSVRIQLCKLLLEDIWNAVPPGTYFDKAISSYGRGTFNPPQSKDCMRNKVDLLDAQMEYLAFVFPNKSVLFVFVDDLHDKILIPLRDYFLERGAPMASCALELYHMQPSYKLNSVVSSALSGPREFIRYKSYFQNNKIIKRELKKYFPHMASLIKKESKGRATLENKINLEIQELHQNFHQAGLFLRELLARKEINRFESEASTQIDHIEKGEKLPLEEARDRSDIELSAHLTLSSSYLLESKHRFFLVESHDRRKLCRDESDLMHEIKIDEAFNYLIEDLIKTKKMDKESKVFFEKLNKLACKRKPNSLSDINNLIKNWLDTPLKSNKFKNYGDHFKEKDRFIRHPLNSRLTTFSYMRFIGNLGRAVLDRVALFSVHPSLN